MAPPASSMLSFREIDLFGSIEPVERGDLRHNRNIKYITANQWRNVKRKVAVCLNSLGFKQEAAFRVPKPPLRPETRRIACPASAGLAGKHDLRCSVAAGRPVAGKGRPFPQRCGSRPPFLQPWPLACQKQRRCKQPQRPIGRRAQHLRPRRPSDCESISEAGGRQRPAPHRFASGRSQARLRPCVEHIRRLPGSPESAMTRTVRIERFQRRLDVQCTGRQAVFFLAGAGAGRRLLCCGASLGAADDGASYPGPRDTARGLWRACRRRGMPVGTPNIENRPQTLRTAAGGPAGGAGVALGLTKRPDRAQ